MFKMSILPHLFFNQKMEAKDPEKKMPSTAAKAITRSPNVAYMKTKNTTLNGLHANKVVLRDLLFWTQSI